MNDRPFSPGGFIPSRGPDSDLVPAFLSPGEPVMSMEDMRDWLASGLPLEDWMEQRRREKEGGDDHQG